MLNSLKEKLVFSKKWLIAIFLLAFVARIILLSANIHNAPDIANAVKGDDGYFELMHNIVSGNGFSYESAPPFSPNPLRPPLYPYMLAFLWAISGSYIFVILIQIILGSLIPVIGSVVVDKFKGGYLWLPVLVGLILAIEPYSMLMSVIFYTETLFTFLFLIFLYFLFSYIKHKSWSNLVWTSVFLALAVLVKPTVQYLPILFPLLFMWQSKKWISKEIVGKSVAFIGIFVAIITPWLYRNYVEFGKVGMGAQPAFNLYIYLAPTVRAFDNGTSFATELKTFVIDKGIDEENITLETSEYYTKEALKEILKHPKGLIKSFIVSELTFFTHDGMLTYLGYMNIRPDFELGGPVWSTLHNNPKEFFKLLSNVLNSPFAVVLLVRIFWIVISLGLLFWIYNVYKTKGYNIYYFIGLILTLYFSSTTAINGLGVNARFRIPVLAFILSFALIGLFELYSAVVSLKNRTK